MPLFSVIGLIIAVFGSTYTAISAFRTHYNPIISDFIKQAPDKVSFIRKIRGNVDGDVGQAYYSGMLTAFKWWHWFSIIPIALFLSFAFLLSLWLFCNWSQIGGTFDSQNCKTMLEINSALNFISLLGAGFSYAVLRNNNFHLTQQFKLAFNAAAGPANGNKPT